MKEMFIDIRPADDCCREQFGDDAMNVKIKEDGHFGSVILSRENALILRAAVKLYEAVKKSNDFITPSKEAIHAEMDALDYAEGEPIGDRWTRYLKSKEPRP